MSLLVAPPLVSGGLVECSLLSQHVLQIVPVVLGGKSHEPLALFVHDLEVYTLLQEPIENVKLVGLDGVVDWCLIQKINLIMVGPEALEELAGCQFTIGSCVEDR